MKKFVVVTTDTSGLGWTKKLQEEGEQVCFLKLPTADAAEAEAYARAGQGLVEIVTDPAPLIGPDTYWIFDRNCAVDLATELRGKGQKVFGVTPLSERMEHDRGFCADIAQVCGLTPPPTVDCHTVQEGLDVLAQNPEKAYVLKPNASEESYSTFVPVREDPCDANHETSTYLRHLPEPKHGYILQERVEGVEVNVEAWIYNGVPIFAFGCLENKRRWNRDLGEMVGCAGDITFVLPLDSPLVRATVGRMFEFYRVRNYTGFADVNVIVGDGRMWFLEVCNRFGYNSHPNLFLALAMDGFGHIVCDFMDGRLTDPYRRFRAGFGASVTVSIDHKRDGIPIRVAGRTVQQFYPFDGRKEGEDLLLSGYGQEVGIFTAHGYTIGEAASKALDQLVYREAVSFPDIAFRTDLGDTNYKGAPINRYTALQSMRWL